jgi:hypothetical protein
MKRPSAAYRLFNSESEGVREWTLQRPDAGALFCLSHTDTMFPVTTFWLVDLLLKPVLPASFTMVLGLPLEVGMASQLPQDKFL